MNVVDRVIMITWIIIVIVFVIIAVVVINMAYEEYLFKKDKSCFRQIGGSVCRESGQVLGRVNSHSFECKDSPRHVGVSGDRYLFTQADKYKCIGSDDK